MQLINLEYMWCVGLAYSIEDHFYWMFSHKIIRMRAKSIGSEVKYLSYIEMSANGCRSYIPLESIETYASNDENYLKNVGFFIFKKCLW